ncbi:MAG TPA: hypothetical protein VKU92_13625 [Acidimicrobiales bacterium]|nr:hypothetical protein [Acidimicrobiales bacterium]
MPVQDDCRHYVRQTVRGGELLERCRLGANHNLPFACPEGCVFFEPRRTSSAGWQVRDRHRDDRPEGS